MFNTATEFISNQIVSTTIWNLAETGVQRTQQYLNHYLAAPNLPGPAEGMDPEEMAPSKKIYCISFNQDCSCLAVGHDDGYSFYSLSKLMDKLEKIQDAKVPERACIVEKLFNSSLITVVSMKSTRKLQVIHSKKENEICSHTYASSIIAVRMNRKRVIVCLEDAIHIHNVRDMRLMHMIKETPLNPQGIMDLSNDDNNCYLAFPSSDSTGHVHIFDADNLVTVIQIAAHNGILAGIRFNPEGNKLATGSEKGTVIRVFAIPTGERLFEFSRGVSRCVQISSLAFSQDSRYLCLSSNTETVHIFALIPSEQQQSPHHPHHHHHQKSDESASAAQEGLSGWMSYFSQQASHYLPQQVNDLMLREKSIATARLPILGPRTVVAMPRIQGTDYLLVASMDGYLFCYSLPSGASQTSGGGIECLLMRQYRIGPPRNEEQNQEEMEGLPITIGRTPQRTTRSSESESQSHQQQSATTPHQQQRAAVPQTTPIKSMPPLATTIPSSTNRMRAGSGGNNNGSSSSLSSASGPPSATAPLPAAAQPKQMPPPMPPNPPKRTAKTSTGPVKEFTTKSSSNPFDMEDLVIPLDEEGMSIRETETETVSSGDALSPTFNAPIDLNDMKEFPPMHYNTNTNH